jgi:uncharacterized RDD family membrane protein YckC
MNGSAVQRDESTEQGNFLATGTDSAVAFQQAAAYQSAAALKQIAAERLAAHRNRRAEVAATEAEREAAARVRAESLRRKSSQGASRVRDAVAARYQQSVSYREYLALEGARALEQAQAEAEVAARNAHAVAEAQMQLLEELEQWKQHESSPREKAIAEQRANARGERSHALEDFGSGADELVSEPPSLSIMDLSIMEVPGREMSGGEMPWADTSERRPAGLQVRLHEQLEQFHGIGGPAIGHAPQVHAVSPGMGYAPAGHRVEFDELDQLDELDQEIEFRRAPEFQEHTLQSLPIQANIIEFPRQLVASRKARPRLAEGPLREDTGSQPQLRIFEVEPEQISVDAEAGEGSGAPEWQGLLLDAADPAPMEMAQDDLDERLRPHAASVPRRVMALAVDGCCVMTAFIGFCAVIAEIAGPTLRNLEFPALGAAVAGTLLVFAILYQMLFFSLAEATPGMRYARVGLCTFNNENPTRSAMRRRILALLVAACPLGLGLIWMALDDDRLGWHDRISRMYPRAY